MSELQGPAFAELKRSLPELQVCDTQGESAELAECDAPGGLAHYLDYYKLDTRLDFPEVGYRIGWIASAGERIATQLWRQQGERDVLLLVHGYFDHVGLFGHLVRYGLARGYHVIAFDLPGHGLSTGPQGVIERFGLYGEAIQAVRGGLCRLGPTWDVIAQSTGAAALMDVLGNGHDGSYRHIVLFAPLLRPRGWWWIRMAHSLLAGRRDSVKRGFAENSHDAEFLEFVRRDPLQAQSVSLAWIGALRRWLPGMLKRPPCQRALLVVQGDEDQTVDWKFNLKKIRQLFPAVEVCMIAQGRHHLANESEGIRAGIGAAMDAWLGRD